jgi:hypothetical protein
MLRARANSGEHRPEWAPSPRVAALENVGFPDLPDSSAKYSRMCAELGRSPKINLCVAGKRDPDRLSELVFTEQCRCATMARARARILASASRTS